MFKKGSLVITKEDIQDVGCFGDDVLRIIPKGTKCILDWVGSRINAKEIEFIVITDKFSVLKTIAVNKEEMKLKGKEHYFQICLNNMFNEIIIKNKKTL